MSGRVQSESRSCSLQSGYFIVVGLFGIKNVIDFLSVDVSDVDSLRCTVCVLIFNFLQMDIYFHT